MKNILLIVCAVFLSAALGCGGGNPVSGTVKFADGTPLTTGDVTFANGTHTFYGTLNDRGEYEVLNVGKTKGIPDGRYTVWLSRTGVTDSTDDSVVATVSSKFTSASRSELSFEVKAGKNTFDITVEKP